MSDEAKRRVKFPEPSGGIVEDPNRPGTFLWSYEMRGPMVLPFIPPAAKHRVPGWLLKR